VALSAFEDPDRPPSADELVAVLGPAAAYWDELVADVRGRAGEAVERWCHGGARSGWSCRLTLGERVLVYLTPQAGAMLVGVVVGEKAIERARAAGIASEATLAAVDAAPRYAEGRGVRVTVRTPHDLAMAKELARIKLGA
jgi:hypothetical protein